MARLKRCDKCGNTVHELEIRPVYEKSVRFNCHNANPNLSGPQRFVTLKLSVESRQSDVDLCESCMKALFQIAETPSPEEEADV